MIRVGEPQRELVAANSGKMTVAMRGIACVYVGDIIQFNVQRNIRRILCYGMLCGMLWGPSLSFLCLNESQLRFASVGLRPIKVCKRWIKVNQGVQALD